MEGEVKEGGEEGVIMVGEVRMWTVRRPWLASLWPLTAAKRKRNKIKKSPKKHASAKPGRYLPIIVLLIAKLRGICHHLFRFLAQITTTTQTVLQYLHLSCSTRNRRYPVLILSAENSLRSTLRSLVKPNRGMFPGHTFDWLSLATSIHYPRG